MGPFTFLFAIGIAWIVFATIQDLRTREVANWLTFSLIAVALAYRGFASVSSGNWSILLWGIAGGFVFVGLAYAFYYGRAFAGGDAKLLMGVGVALPYDSGETLVTWGSAFLFILFFGGAVYTLLYSCILVARQWHRFCRHFTHGLWAARWLFAFSFALLIVLRFFASGMLWLWGSVALLALPGIYVYLRSVEQACMIRTVPPRALREGDWLYKPVTVRGKLIAASVHGLSAADIALMHRGRKTVTIKEGVPFVPAFLLAYGVMGYAALSGRLDWPFLSSLLSSLVQAF